MNDKMHQQQMVCYWASKGLPHPMNQAWKAFDKYSRESLSVVDIKKLEKEVNEMMEGWRTEHDMGMHTYPQQAVNMGLKSLQILT